jgi:hypothetical protein
MLYKTIEFSARKKLVIGMLRQAPGDFLKQSEVAINPRKLVCMNIIIEKIFEAPGKTHHNSVRSYIEKLLNAWYTSTRAEQKIAILLLAMLPGMILLAPHVVKGQGNARELTMERAVEIALKNNPQVKNFELEALASKKLIKSAVDIASPSLLVEEGKINSEFHDYKVIIS